MELIQQFGAWVMGLLPRSPFVAFIDALEQMPFLSTLNYFVPIGTFVAIGEAWLVSIGIFYLYSIILRWIRAIE